MVVPDAIIMGPLPLPAVNAAAQEVVHMCVAFTSILSDSVECLWF